MTLHPFSPKGKGQMVSDSAGLWFPKKDIDALLAVLRRCVGWMGEQFCPEDTNCVNCREGREIMVAARPWLEEAEARKEVKR